MAGAGCRKARCGKEGRRGPGLAERDRKTRDRSGRTSLPYRSGDQPWNRRYDHLIRLRGPDRGFRFPPGEGGAAVDRNRPVDVPLKALRGGVFRENPGQSGSGSAQLLRLRIGRRNYRSGQRHPDRFGKDLYGVKDRRSQQPGSRQDPDPFSDFRPAGQRGAPLYQNRRIQRL